MFTGWRRDLKFEVNRPLTADEKKDALSHDAAKSESYDDHFGLVALNSTYIEWVDRRFRARGSGTTFLASVTCLASLGWIAFSVLFAVKHRDPTASVLIAVGIFGFGLFYWRQCSIDFFQKVYWPIRFNRKNRMIYVYRDKRDGGILRVPWDKVYFHVGYGMVDSDYYDIRGEILDGDTVKDTFALGQYSPGLNDIREMWAFICRYMDGGPEAVGPDPNDRYVELSVRGTLRSCALVVYTNYAAPNALIRAISIPFIAASTLTRWLVFKTCRMPRWPEDIEAACKVEPNDPDVWPQPKYINQFVEEMPDVRRRKSKRIQANRQATWNAEPRTDLDNAMAELDAAMRRERGC